MTSILGTIGTISSYLSAPAAGAPTALSQAISSGTVNAANQGALAGAMSDISAALQASPPAIGTDTATMQARIGGMIDQEVSNGHLTSTQAGELKQLYASNPAASSTTTGLSATGTNGTAGGLGGTLQSVVDFARDLRLAIKGQSPYGAAGTATAASPAAMLVNTLA